MNIISVFHILNALKKNTSLIFNAILFMFSMCVTNGNVKRVKVKKIKFYY